MVFSAGPHHRLGWKSTCVYRCGLLRDGLCKLSDCQAARHFLGGPMTVVRFELAGLEFLVLNGRPEYQLTTAGRSWWSREKEEVDRLERSRPREASTTCVAG